MKCPKCKRRRSRITYTLKGERRMMCRKCRHDWKIISVKTEEPNEPVNQTQ